MTDAKNNSQRADRFGAPEGHGGESFRYFDKYGKEQSLAEWLKRVKEDAEKAKKKK